MEELYHLSILPVDQSNDRASRSAPTSRLLRVCRLQLPSYWIHTLMSADQNKSHQVILTHSFCTSTSSTNYLSMFIHNIKYVVSFCEQTNWIQYLFKFNSKYNSSMKLIMLLTFCQRGADLLYILYLSLLIAGLYLDCNCVILYIYC